MFIPDFLFEPEDISILKDENIFMGEYIHKGSGLIYFKINTQRFNRLVDILYANSMFSDKDKSDVEFDIRILIKLFTEILIDKTDRKNTLLGIIGYHQINPNNAKILMTLI